MVVHWVLHMVIAVVCCCCSTALWEALPEAVMDHCVRLHHSCMRGLLPAHRGYESCTEVRLCVLVCMCGGGAHSLLLLPATARLPRLQTLYSICGRGGRRACSLLLPAAQHTEAPTHSLHPVPHLTHCTLGPTSHTALGPTSHPTPYTPPHTLHPRPPSLSDCAPQCSTV